MAATLEGRALTEAHRLLQARISARTVEKLIEVWSLLDPTSIDRTASAWLARSLQVVAQQHKLSSQAAAAYQRQFRAVELGRRPQAVGVAADPLNLQQIATSLTTQGPYRLRKLTANGTPIAEAVATSSHTSAAAGTRHSLNGGRSLIDNATGADPDAIGARRVCSAGCCAFCAMLAARSYSGLSAEHFKAHDNCHCQPETAYSAGPQDATRQAREFAALYSEAQEDRRPGTKNPGLNAFRRALTEQRRN
jgi:hypothetical protein